MLKLLLILTLQVSTVFSDDFFSGIELKGYFSESNKEITEITAYIHRSQVSLNNNKVTVISPSSNIRIGPSTEYDILNIAKKGDNYPSLGIFGEWYKIALPDTYAKSTQGQVQIGIVKVNSSLNLRESPDGKVLRTLKNGARVEIIASEGSWYKVNYAGQQGYVSKRYIYEDNGDYTGLYEQESDPSNLPIQSNLAKEVKRTAGGGVEVTGVPLYAQRGIDPFDSRGGSGQYPGAYCGPTSLQMVLAYYGINKSRDYLALTNPGGGQMYIKGTGSAYGPMVKMAQSLGLKNTKITWNSSISTIKKALIEGRPQIISVQGKISYKDGVSYSTNGHIMVITGVTDSGDLIIQDPAIRNNGRRIMSSSQFLKIWRGFNVDLKK